MYYKGYQIEIEYIGEIDDYLYHVKKDDVYIKTNLISKRACQLYITKIIKGGV